MKNGLFLIPCLLLAIACQPKADRGNATTTEVHASAHTEHLEHPDSAMAELKAGNVRYVSGQSVAFNALAGERSATAAKQHPFAIVVCCSDSRVPPEEVFDQGIGRLFVIRTAGSVLDQAAMGSIEYAAEHLGVKLVVVLGHERCGAVTAAVEGGEAPGAVGYIVEQIRPAVESAKTKEGDLLMNAIHDNMALVQSQISSSEPILKHLVDKGELKVVGAYYDLDEGTVVF
ncbi:carbonic anhydrase [Breznakibacter xylanolyticus]|uniref:carbonic anhydrase n=1 Tax=Breznakibacter xylanolyticus TaxID=990 RepID=A0A2W7NJG5_9BACT|nr:carbonic anhydrase [Breznakibacter xylanolyticus]PZX16854.1 carbonic anhydrase [Breznakibacter xylanolyticus]